MKHSEGFLNLVTEVRKSIKETTVPAVQEWLKKRPQEFILIDVREDHEWAEGHIHGAIHLGKGIIERDIETKIPNKSQELVLYCGGGYRSALAAHNLQQMGYQNVLSMDGGVRGWKDAGGTLSTTEIKS